ncbi:EAL domain-containing response regulator [Thalassolituus sp. LLYu03]|uniref:EAL domain-containing response regulator n=1 Tax=Thalassolituus sp. LLYu03 TaxID=3421656 RepID=UPI003D277DA1
MQRNILLVDDEAGIIHAIRRMLRAEPYQIFEASNGHEALTILERHDIHLMISDFKMPGMDGLTLCHKTRQISPTTYRLLLSGQVDYSGLRRAWQDGDVHRFVAKPWDNLLLAMDIKEGIKQHELLARMNLLSQELQGHQPTLLTDSNWIVRLANAPMCSALECQEKDLLGINLFASALSDMPVTLETEVTRQVEEGKTWLGHFNLTGPGGTRHQVWMAIAPIGDQYRLCSCNWVAEDLDPVRDLRDEINRYSGEHHLDRLQIAVNRSRVEPHLMVVSFSNGDSMSKDLAAICYERLQAATDDLYEIYSPQAGTFLILQPSVLSAEQTERLAQIIREDFDEPMSYQGQNMVLKPQITIESKPAHINEWDDWLRQRLGLSVKMRSRTQQADVQTDTNSAPSSVNRHKVVPVFNQNGELVALSVPGDACRDGDWDAWLKDICAQWQADFNRELQLVVSATEHSQDAIRALTSVLLKREQAPKCAVVLGEDCVLSEGADDLNWRDELRARGCSLFIANFGRSFVNSRQVLSLPIQGVCLAPEFLTHMRSSKSLPQSRRLLQRIHDNGLIIFAPGMDDTESLASAHQTNVDWLAGGLLSPAITADQLQWFSPAGEIG